MDLVKHKLGETDISSPRADSVPARNGADEVALAGVHQVPLVLVDECNERAVSAPAPPSHHRKGNDAREVPVVRITWINLSNTTIGHSTVHRSGTTLQVLTYMYIHAAHYMSVLHRNATHTDHSHSDCATNN